MVQIIVPSYHAEHNVSSQHVSINVSSLVENIKNIGNHTYPH